MEFTFNVTVTIYDDDIDKMVKNVKKYKMNIKDAIYAVLGDYDDFEYCCSDYYYNELKAEVERRLENGV